MNARERAHTARGLHVVRNNCSHDCTRCGPFGCDEDEPPPREHKAFTIFATACTAFALFVALMFLIGGCGASALHTQAIAADTLAQAANAVSDEIEYQYEAAQIEAMSAACASVPDDAPCQDESRAAVDAVRETWDPVFVHAETLRVAHAAWADAIEFAASTGIDGSVPVSRYARLAARAVDAYDALADSLHALGLEIPRLPNVVMSAAAMFGGGR